MFCLGVLTLTAQFTFTRELLALGTGNELTIGIVITVWLVWAGVGGWAGRWAAKRADARWWERKGAVLLAGAGVLTPVMVAVLRTTAGGAPVGAGEYVSLSWMLGLSAVVLMPVCGLAGFLFPAACAVWERGRAGRGVGAVYAAEALGSCAGGLFCTFVLAEHSNGLQGATTAAATGAAAAFVTSTGRWRLFHGALGVAALVCVLYPPALAGLDRLTLEQRCERLGMIGRGTGSSGGVRLVATADTRYQQLALVEGGGQFTLYADGQVAYSFPDPLVYEHVLHMVMAQKPDARRVLVIGGNPAGDIPVLLGFPLERLVRVDLDPGGDALIRRAVPEVMAAVDADGRMQTRYGDGVRYVKTSTDRYDAILIRLPEPVTVGINRFYTREFYADAGRLLAPGGFLYTSIEASERLEEDAVRVAASVHHALKAVFPEVKVTAGTPTQFFAANATGVLTFDARELDRRWRAVQPRARYFRPEYFGVADEIEPRRVAAVEARLASCGVAANSIETPVSCFQMLVLWSRYSGSRIEAALRWVEHVRPWLLSAAILLAGVVWVAAVRGRGIVGMKAGAGVLMAGAGFGAVALELALVYAFQGVWGLIYSQIGFLVGIFMLGAVIGAVLGRSMEAGSARRTVAGLAGGMLLLLLVAARIWWLAGIGSTVWSISALIMGVGMALGWQFVCVSRLFQLAGLSTGAAASATNATDYAGSALGGLCTGIVLVPVFGLRATGMVVTAMLGACLLILWGVSGKTLETGRRG